MKNKYQENLNKLLEIGKLEPNWDGEGGKAFDGKFINVIKGILEHVLVQPDRIFPCGRGSIQFEYGLLERGGRYLEFEIFPDVGSYIKLFHKPGGKHGDYPVSIGLKDESDKFKETIIGVTDINEWISAFWMDN